MVIEAAVIEIDRAAGRHTVICNTHLRMTEAGRPLIDFHAVAHQTVIEGTSHTVDHLFIRNTRRDDPDVHAALCRQRKCMCHLIRNDQIRRHKPAVFLRFIRHTDIHLFPDMLMIDRTVRIRLDKSRLLRCVRIIRQKLCEIRIVLVFIADSIPHFQKRHRQ